MEQEGPDVNLKDEQGIQAEGKEDKSVREATPTGGTGWLMQEGAPQREKVCSVVLPPLIWS